MMIFLQEIAQFFSNRVWIPPRVNHQIGLYLCKPLPIWWFTQSTNNPTSLHFNKKKKIRVKCTLIHSWKRKFYIYIGSVPIRNCLRPFYNFQSIFIHIYLVIGTLWLTCQLLHTNLTNLRGATMAGGALGNQVRTSLATSKVL